VCLPTALGAALALAGAARAQVVLDGSLGPAGPAPFDGTTYDITDDLGTRSGANLFHSFSLFDVPSGQTASFHLLDPSTPEPDFVVARVTGGDPSDIGGRIQSLHDGADLFLLNPSGFSFGPNSAVEALGSVAVSTSDVLRFGDDPPFDARSSAPPPVLSADAPTAFGFLGDAPAAIAFDQGSPSGFDFPLPAGETLTLVGGDVRIEGPSASSGNVQTIRIEGGGVEIAAVASAGIDVPVEVADFDARGQAPGALGEVEISRNAFVDVGSPLGAPVGSGRVVIRGGRIVIDDARIDAVAGSGLPGPERAVDLEAAESVEIRAGSRITAASAVASAGDLRISAEAVEITGSGTRLTATASGAGAAPDVEIEAGSLHVGDEALVFLRTTQPAGQTGGRLAVDAEQALLDGGALVENRAQGAAAGGGIAFDVGELRVAGDAAVQSRSLAAGAGGPIEIAAGDVRVDTRGQIVSENTGSGPGGAIDVGAEGEVVVESLGNILSRATGAASNAGGDVRVAAGERILVTGQDSTDADASQISALTSSSSPDGTGGRLRVSAPVIELRDAGQLRTTTSGAAQGGSLDVADTDLLRVVGNATIEGTLSGAGLFARVAQGASGAGGALTIAARVVEVEDGGEVSTRTLGSGDAGDLRIRDAERVVVRGGPRGVSTLSTRGAAGDGGDLEIDLAAVGGELELASGGLVSASTVGSGDAGDLRIAADRVTISGAPSGLFSQTTFGATASGAAGNIAVEVGSWLEVSDGGRISVDSQGGGEAGDVSIAGGPAATIALVGGNVSARSRGTAEAGSVSIRTGRDFVAGRGASVETRAEGNASGGRVAISAGRIAYASDARIETLVDAGLVGTLGNGGDVDVPPPLASAPPEFAVLNRSSIVATAIDGNGGNIRVAAGDLLASQGVVIDATSERGVSGDVRITGPDADLAGQITPLPSNFFDASKLMSTPCDARRTRAGSFVVQTRSTIAPLPDAPLPPSLVSREDVAPAAGGPGGAKCPG
jgi:filamentous hemagglutinin family protein